jgi:alkanesulfonate monooxygenase SsuD/methylene tetrahydromethanopterin reductase-like flavin-dependent oxidoreductase (luciferase family)
MLSGGRFRVTAPSRQIHLGLFLHAAGHHVAGWRYPGAEFGSENLAHLQRIVATAERAKFDMVFFADGIGIRADDNPPGSLARSNRNAELEPLTLLSALAASTSHIGLVSTASTTYNEPFHIARKFASLDYISNGRAGCPHWAHLRFSGQPLRF